VDARVNGIPDRNVASDNNTSSNDASTEGPSLGNKAGRSSFLDAAGEVPVPSSTAESSPCLGVAEEARNNTLLLNVAVEVTARSNSTEARTSFLDVAEAVEVPARSSCNTAVEEVTPARNTVKDAWRHCDAKRRRLDACDSNSKETCELWRE
jgi:hypothetical protein